MTEKEVGEAQREGLGQELEPERGGGRADEYEETEEGSHHDQGVGQDAQELREHSPNRDTFQAVQDLIASRIRDLENSQGSDQPEGLHSTSVDHQPSTPNDGASQVVAQRESDTETRDPSPLSTPARSPLAVLCPSFHHGRHPQSAARHGVDSDTFSILQSILADS